MTTEKSLIFISHITEEKELAIEFKLLVEEAFLGMIEVFVSSDENSIQLGNKWLDSITNSLKECAVEIILCSPASIKRPWINFEAGAGWIRDIPVIPLCHSGMTPSLLPIPLNLLQAAQMSQISSLKLLFPVLAEALGAKTPRINYDDFVQKVENFEKKYTFWNKFNDNFKRLNDILEKSGMTSEQFSKFKKGLVLTVELTEITILKLNEATSFLQNEKLINFERTGAMEMNNTGVYYKYHIIPSVDLEKLTSNACFKSL